MFLKICHLDIILLAILSASKITTAEDYASSEEVTTTSIDFFDSENTNEFFDPLQQSDKNYQDISDHKSHEADVINYNKFTSDEEITQKNVLTTMVPDYIQMFSDMMINGEESYLKENDSRSSETAATNETLPSPSYPIKNSIYSDKDLDIVKNISEDNHMMDSQDDEDIDQLEAGTTTLMTPTVRTKQGKQIQIIKLLPHEALRNYIEDAYIRTPLAAVVDTSSYSLEKTKTLWKDALRPNAALDIVLLAFNASGVSVTYHFQNTRTFLAGLESIKEESTGNAFYGIIRASELIPYDSAVFVSTATVPTGANLAQYAAITLLKKRIRLYLIWFGEKTFSENETQEVTGGILGEVAIRSGGEILHIGNDSSKDLDENMLTVVSENYHGPQQIEIPVETTMSSLHIKIDSMMKAATLETPNGEIRLKSLRKFSVLQFNDKKVDKLDVSIPLAKFTQPTKFFLKVIPEDEAKSFWVLVKAQKRKPRMELGKEVFDNTLQPMNLVEIFNLNNKKLTTEKRDEHKLEKIRFPSDGDDDETELIENDVNYNNITTTNAKQIGVLQGITKIDVGIQSQLLVAPGMMAQIYFEVTNLRSEPVYHSIQVRDEQRYLTDLNPQSLWLPAGQTGTATLTVRVPPEAVQGTRDKITFICQGYGRASQSLELKVVSVSDTQDTTPPRLSWTFGSRCDGNFASNSCSERIWSLEITAQDWESGILRIQSTPQGITSRIPFTVGTSEPARVTYTSTCCQPRVSISAYDLAGNQRTADIDVRDIILTDASIAAIVLGALLLILLIILFICLIVWCCKRRKESRDLPSFRSHPERR